MKKLNSVMLSCALVAAQLGVVSAPSSAAGNAGCACQSTAANAATVGTISSVKGDVMIVGDKGYEAAKVGSKLARNGQIITGANATVAGSMGGCKFAVPANATMSVVESGQKVCLKVSGVDVAPAAFGEEGSLLPLALGVVLIGGGIGLAIGLSDDKNPASP